MNWHKIKAPWPEFADAFQHKLVPITVMRSLSKSRDGTEWYHLSVSRPDRIPNWDELTKVRDELLGEGFEAYHVIAKLEDHVNIHSRCMHIWARVDGSSCVANLQSLVDERSPSENEMPFATSYSEGKK